MGIEYQSHYRQIYTELSHSVGERFSLYGADEVRGVLAQATTRMATWKLCQIQAEILQHRGQRLLQDPQGDVMDIDVTPLLSFAPDKEGAEVGFNRKYKGRPCFQLPGSMIGKAVVDAKLFPGSDNPKEFFQRAIKRALALGYPIRILRGDAAYLSKDNVRFALKRNLGYALGASAQFKAVKEGIALFKQRARKKHIARLSQLVKGFMF
jgi:hypothetical protein